MIRVRLLTPDKTETIFESYLRATDNEIEAALEEDGAKTTFSVDLYKRAVPLYRSRQRAASKGGGAGRVTNEQEKAGRRR